MNERRKRGAKQRQLMGKYGSKLERIAAVTGNPIAAIAVRVMRKKANKQRMGEYIQSRGEVPEQVPENPDLETLHQMGQYGQLRSQHIKEKLQELREGNPQAGIAPEPMATEVDAEEEVLGYESEMYGFDADNFDSPDNFIPAIAGIVAKVGQSAGKAIQQSRAKKGKGVFWNKKGFQKGVDDVKKLAGKKEGKPETEVGKAVDEQIKEIEKQKKKDFLKDNIVWIVLGVLLIGFFAYSAGKNKA